MFSPNARFRRRARLADPRNRSWEILYLWTSRYDGRVEERETYIPAVTPEAAAERFHEVYAPEGVILCVRLNPNRES